MELAYACGSTSKHCSHHGTKKQNLASCLARGERPRSLEQETSQESNHYCKPAISTVQGVILKPVCVVRTLDFNTPAPQRHQKRTYTLWFLQLSQLQAKHTLHAQNVRMGFCRSLVFVGFPKLLNKNLNPICEPGTVRGQTKAKSKQLNGTQQLVRHGPAIKIRGASTRHKIMASQSYSLTLCVCQLPPRGHT